MNECTILIEVLMRGIKKQSLKGFSKIFSISARYDVHKETVLTA